MPRRILLLCFVASVGGIVMGCEPVPSTPPAPSPPTTHKARSLGSLPGQPGPGHFVLQIEPLWAKVYRDGKFVGVTSYLPSGDIGIRLPVTPNRSQIEVSKPGFQTRRVALSAAQQRHASRSKGGQVGPYQLHKEATPPPRLSARLQRLKQKVAAAPKSWARRSLYQRALLAAGKTKLAMAHLQEWRRWSPRSTTLLKKQLALLKRTQPKNRQAHMRLRSEWMEFAPTQTKRWLAFGNYLREQRLYQESCRAFTQVIQLDPTRTTLFADIMNFRRQMKTSANVLKHCIKEGVRDMPIERHLTILMMWDRDNVDLDMWVTEPDGTRVSYRNKRSPKGGVLYYDVTRGFGPEIYVSPNVPGTYRLHVVNYTGASGRIPIHFTVLTHAGTPQQRSKSFRKVLNSKRSQRPTRRSSRKEQHWVMDIKVPKRAASTPKGTKVASTTGRTR